MSRVKQTSRNGLKRKRDEDDNTTQVTMQTATSPAISGNMHRKHTATSIITKTAPSNLEDVNEAIGRMDNSLLADYFAKQ